MDLVYWSSLPGLTKSAKWPVRVEDWASDDAKVLVFCRSDNAYFNVKRDQLVPFVPNGIMFEEIKAKSSAAFKKKKMTLDAFLGDIEWALIKASEGMVNKISRKREKRQKAANKPVKCARKRAQDQEFTALKTGTVDPLLGHSLEDSVDESHGESADGSAQMTQDQEFSGHESVLQTGTDDPLTGSHTQEDFPADEPNGESADGCTQIAQDQEFSGHESILQTGTDDPLPGSHTQEDFPVDESNGESADGCTQIAQDQEFSGHESVLQTGTDDPLPGSHTQEDFPVDESNGESADGCTQMAQDEEFLGRESILHIGTDDLLPGGHTQEDFPVDELDGDDTEEFYSSGSEYVPSDEEHDTDSFESGIADGQIQLAQDNSLPVCETELGTGNTDPLSGTQEEFPVHESDNISGPNYVSCDEEHVSNSGESDVSDVFPALKCLGVSNDSSCPRGRVEWKISKDEMETDVNNSYLYVRKVQSSYMSKTGKAKKNSVVYNQAHACKFCKKVVTNISKHLKKHASEPEIKEVKELGKTLGQRHSQVRAKWDLLRNQGDHNHNLQVIKDGEGEVILGRRQPGKFDISKYGPCPSCFVWILITTMSKHQALCPGNSAKLNKRELRIASLYQSGKISGVASKALTSEVFTIMTNDEIGQVAMNDKLIITLGNMWMTKNMGNELKRKYYTSSRMRDNARLLINLRKETGLKELDMTHFLTPEHFDNVVVAALKTASPAFDDLEDLKAPSTAIKLGYDLKRLAGAKLGIAIKEGSMHEKEKTADFMKLIDMEWTLKVTKIASTTLMMRKFNKEHPLPEPEDIEKITSTVKQEIRQVTEKLRNKPNQALFRRGVILAETRLLMFNKRRAGEIEGIRIKEYVRRTSGTTNLDKAMRSELSEIERTLIENQEVLETRGKFGRGVPVIIPKDTIALLALLADASVRKVAEIKDCNSYLFANNNMGVLRSYDSLKSLCSEMDLQKPEQLTSVKLRKYTATISQVFDLSSQEQSWLVNHLGHSMDIHKIHYRQTSRTIERLDIAKLMLLQEFNITAKYAGRKLCDIDLKELCTDDSGNIVLSSEEFQESQESTVVHDDMEEGCTDVEGYIPDNDIDVPDEYTFDDSTDKERKKNSATTRVMWAEDEVKEIQIYFKENLTTRTTPGMKDCQKAIELSKMSSGTLHRRSWETIKKKVWNMIKKL